MLWIQDTLNSRTFWFNTVLTLPLTIGVLPKDLQLHDDTLLEQVAYSDLEAPPTTKLSGLEQAVVLGQW